MAGRAYHVSLWSHSPALPMLESLPESKHTLIFIPGLTDTFATVPYLDSLADAIASLDFSLVQGQLSSSLGGFGLSSLEADAEEISILIQHLQSRTKNAKPKDGRIVLMGHSTGCQDVVHTLSRHRPNVRIDGAILQAPLSDREDFEANNAEGSKGRELLQQATALKEQGKGGTLMPRDIMPPVSPGQKSRVNGEAFQKPAMTAYRYWSLYAKGGDDDFFSSDLHDERMAEIWRSTIQRGHRVLALLGAEDEYYPAHVSPESLASKWKASASSDRFEAVVVPGANHKVESQEGQKHLIEHVVALVRNVLQEERSGEEENGPAAASFDEIVELISSGKAESIPGVKTIPLKINEATPSVSSLQRPAKPWERST